MFCPRCGAEYRPGFDQCVDCQVPLVDDEPDEEWDDAPEEPDGGFVTVFASGDAGLIAIAKSLLDSADIPFLSKGEGLQDILGMGRFPGNMNIITGPIELQVDPDDAEEASALLREYSQSDPGPPETGDEDPPR